MRPRAARLWGRRSAIRPRSRGTNDQPKRAMRSVVPGEPGCAGAADPAILLLGMAFAVYSRVGDGELGHAPADKQWQLRQGFAEGRRHTR